MKLFLLGATGNSGGRLLAQALARGHEVTALVRMLPKIALSLAFRNRIGEMTISNDDAALVILDNLAPGGPTSHQCVGVALPRGMKAHKVDVPS